MKPTLYILCGVAASGKSTWAFNYIKENIDRNICYVSRDEIRFSILKDDDEYFAHEREVFDIFIRKIVAAFSDGCDVIADATHLNDKSRKKLTRAIDNQFKDYDIIYVIMETSLEECLARNSKRSGRARVPEEAIENMYINFMPPCHNEDEREISRIVIEGEDI